MGEAEIPGGYSGAWSHRMGRCRREAGREAKGAAERRGEDVVGRCVGPQDFLAAIYHHLGIDYDTVTLPYQSGRPIHVIQWGTAIPELTPA